MDHKTVEMLEGEIEKAIAGVIVRMGLKKLPLLPARHTMHMMAKRQLPFTKRSSRTTSENRRTIHDDLRTSSTSPKMPSRQRTAS